MTRYKYPAAVVFDLDYTLWPFWCDTHIVPPVTLVEPKNVVDAAGMNLKLFEDIESILIELIENLVTIIGASRTANPEIAHRLLTLFEVDSKPMINFFHSLQWGQGSKTRHIKDAAMELDLQIELKNGEMILFDDEYRNRDVESINCHFSYIEECQFGLTRRIFEDALKKWTDGK